MSEPTDAAEASEAAQTPTEAGDAAQPQGEAADETQASAEGGAGEAEGRVAQDNTSGANVTARMSRKVREGVVTSAAMDKTVVVTIIERVRHRLYGKTVQRSKRLYVHDENNDCRPGDRVRVAETRPLSKQKRWRLVEVLERAR
jgi:small subunit ribosomal protein S17